MAANEAEVAIIKNVPGPQRASVDGVDVTQPNLGELIEVDRHLASKVAVKNGLGVRRTQVNPPGSV